MANLQVKNVPDDVHEKLRRRAAEEGLTVRDYVLRLLRRDQALPTAQEWLRRVRGREPVLLNRSAADLVAEARAEREAELGEALAERNAEEADEDRRAREVGEPR